MTDDARRVLAEEGRARIHAARRYGGSCALCGRPLAQGETIWMERAAIYGEGAGVVHWRVPVGGECTSPELGRETERSEPERCAACGRGGHRQASTSRGWPELCSTRCASRYYMAHKRESGEGA